MPVGEFVSRQDPSYGAESSSIKNLDARRQLSVKSRVHPASMYLPAAQSQPLANTFNPPKTAAIRTEQSYSQPPITKGLSKGGVFDEESILEEDDSDVTTRGVAAGPRRQYGSVQHAYRQLEPKNGSSPEHPVATECLHDRQGDNFVEPDELNEEFQGDSFDEDVGPNKGLRSRTPTFTAEELSVNEVQQVFSAIQKDPGYQQAEKGFGESVGFTNMSQIPHGRSGRFASAAAYNDPMSNTVDPYQNPVSMRLVTAEYSDPQLEREYDHLQKAGYDRKRQSKQTTVRRDRAQIKTNGTYEDEDELPDSDHEISLGQPSHIKHMPGTPRLVTDPPSPLSKPPNLKHDATELDYESKALSKMNYSELKDQPFEIVPNTLFSDSQQQVADPNVPLEARLKSFASCGADDQKSFFSVMPMDQWEQSGDWFLARFGDIMSQLRTARQAKRNVSKVFEEELAAREEVVRSKADGIQDVLREMRAGGEGVLKGKTP